MLDSKALMIMSEIITYESAFYIFIFQVVAVYIASKFFEIIIFNKIFKGGNSYYFIVFLTPLIILIVLFLVLPHLLPLSLDYGNTARFYGTHSNDMSATDQILLLGDNLSDHLRAGKQSVSKDIANINNDNWLLDKYSKYIPVLALILTPIIRCVIVVFYKNSPLYDKTKEIPKNEKKEGDNSFDSFLSKMKDE